MVMDFDERAARHRKRAEACESSAPEVAGSHRRLASVLSGVAEDVRKNKDALQKAAE